MILRPIVSVLIVISLMSSFASSQEIEAHARVDSSMYRIGEWIVIHFEAQVPEEVTVSMPYPRDTLGVFEIIELGETIEESDGPKKLYRRDITVTIFDTGSYRIPAIAMRVRTPQDSVSVTYYSNSIPVTVKGVEIDTSRSFRDIKDVLSVSLTVWDYLLYAAIPIALILLGYFGYRFYQKRKAQVPERIHEPVIPPHIRALQALQLLADKHLWENGRDKEYQSELTQILRDYIERRLQVPALEMTSNELIAHLIRSGIQRESIEMFDRILQKADLTKFAKYHPTSGENMFAMAGAISFVEETKPLESSSRNEADHSGGKVSDETARERREEDRV